VRAWIDRAGIERGTPIMRMITPNGFVAARGITGQGIGIALRAAVRRTLISQGMAEEEAEEQAKAISGHSGRVGFATVAAEAGADLGQIAATTRHTDMRIVQRYTRAAEQRRRSAHKLPGVGV
jgi:integrase